MHVQSGGGVTVDSIDDGVFGHDEAVICCRPPMTVVMLLGFAVMTRTYSCCWSTGHGAVIYRIVSPSRWRSGMVLS